METNLVYEGVKFMFLGMGTVYVFLTIMIVMMYLQAKIIRRCFPEPGQQPAQTMAAARPEKTDDTNKKVAAITAAVLHHNATKK